MAEYKKTYTKEEMDELLAWVEKNKLTGSFSLAPGITIDNLELFCESMSHVLTKQYENVNYSGQIHMMFELREKWEEQHSQTSIPVPPSSSDQ